jgi:hypothetical protein
MIDSTEHERKIKIILGLINENLEPIKYTYGSVEFYHKTIYDVFEKDRYCKECNNVVGYWSYGHWIP